MFNLPMFHLKQNPSSPRGIWRLISTFPLAVYGSFFALGALSILLYETDFPINVARCHKLRFGGCIKEREGSISHDQALEIATPIGLVGLAVYLVIAFLSIYGKRLSLVVGLRHRLDPKLRFTVTCFFNFFASMIVNTFCTRLSVFFTRPVDVKFALVTQASLLFFLLAGLTNVDLGIIDFFTALALTGMPKKPNDTIFKWLLVCVLGSLKHILVPFYIYNFGENSEVTRMREVIQDALHKANISVASVHISRDLLPQMAPHNQCGQFLKHAIDEVERDIKITRRMSKYVANLREMSNASLSVEFIAARMFYAIEGSRHATVAAARARACVEFVTVMREDRPMRALSLPPRFQPVA